MGPSLWPRGPSSGPKVSARAWWPRGPVPSGGSRGITPSEWRDLLRRVLLAAGLEERPTALLLTDQQLTSAHPPA